MKSIIQRFCLSRLFRHFFPRYEYLSIPLILAFTGNEDIVERGFTALETMPDFYKTAVGVVFAASLGVQKLTKMFKKQIPLEKGGQCETIRQQNKHQLWPNYHACLHGFQETYTKDSYRYYQSQLMQHTAKLLTLRCCGRE